MDEQWHCPYCCTDLQEVDDFYWCTECAQFWWLEQVETGRIPQAAHWQIRNGEQARLDDWNRKVEGN